ncbi:uncharacterized protein LOC110896956 [Helianthus annuus]|uniref:uncharacterized protein LOC110896956 n=1 Tax=Helianthus annuus TaxID=4232 RepID=UPI000B905E63|nr:uncharacterized protein LOC110896956 [Helianthus annuus]
MAAYCKEVKLLSDQLNSVGCPVDNQRLVLQLLTGLSERYDGISTILQNRDPLPDFNEARSRLTMEEKKKSHQVAANATVSATALATSTQPSSDSAPPTHTNLARSSGSPNSGPTNSRNRSRGRGRNNPGRGNRVM